MFTLSRSLLFGSFAALAAAVAAASPASAQEEPRSVAVSYADLDLSTADGVGRLDRRVRNAADRVCSVNGARDLKTRGMVLACKEQTLANARQHVQMAVNAALNGQQLAQNGVTVRAGR